jgi:hypothetical protein
MGREEDETIEKSRMEKKKVGGRGSGRKTHARLKA